MLRTTDGGEFWDILRVPKADSLDFRGVYGFDRETVVVMSAGLAEAGQARIYRTEDGGESWQLAYETKQPGVFLDGISFWNKKEGICFGDPIEGRFFILTTNDGGQSWQELPAENRPVALPKEAAFAASNRALLTVGKHQAFIGTGGGERARVLRSEDNGRTWQASETPLAAGPTSGIFGLQFWSNQHGIAVGGDYADVTQDSPNVLLTRDGGATWKLSKSMKPAGLKEAVGLFHSQFVNYAGGQRPTKHHYRLVAVGASGSGFSTDFGQTWQTMGNEPFHTVTFAGPTGYAAGGKGLVGKFDKFPKKRK